MLFKIEQIKQNSNSKEKKQTQEWKMACLCFFFSFGKAHINMEYAISSAIY